MPGTVQNPPAHDLAGSYEEVSRRIRAATVPEHSVTLIAVSKTQSPEAIEALYRLGQRDFGESYVQELLAKASALKSRGCNGIRWHFIGHLQTNKVKQLLPEAYAIHTIDSERLAREVAKRWKALLRTEKLPVFLEINIDQEEGKAGLNIEDAEPLARLISEDPSLSSALSLEGLMCIPDPEQGSEGARRAFQRVRTLAGALPCRGRLSMGMSDDFELAIAEGATHVRVGTELFGARNIRPPLETGG